MSEPWLIRFFACNREMQPFSFFFFFVICCWGGGGGDFGSGSGFKFNCAARVGSGWVRRSRVRAGFGLQFWARADLYFLPNCFLPVNFVFNMLWYSTHWTATPFSNEPLCGGCQWSSSGPLPSQQCSPLLWFQRTRHTQNLYCMDGHLLKLKCKYSIILIYWFLTSIRCKL